MKDFIQQTALAVLLCVSAMGAFGAEDGRVTLKTDRSTVIFDRARNGAVVSLVDNATGTEFVNGSVAQDLFGIAWSQPGDTSGKLQRLAGRDAEQVEWEVSDRRLTAVMSRRPPLDNQAQSTVGSVSRDHRKGETCDDSNS